MLLYCDANGVVKLASTTPVDTDEYRVIETDDTGESPIGKRVLFDKDEGVRLAVICNWNDDCGISSYAKYLVDALAPKVSDVHVFSERNGHEKFDNGPNISYCWDRGRPMGDAMRRVIDWRPSAVLIQHEFGIFPKATYLLQMLQMLDAADIPYVVTLHSVYEHLDKVVCTAPMKNVVVHSHTGKECLKRLGFRGEVEVIPHGCVIYDNVKENWNIFQTPHAIMQFGFGFGYKGVDVALRAVSYLKDNGFPDIFYLYLCSESIHAKNINNAYYSTLNEQIASFGLQDNAVIIRGYQTEDTLVNYLRTVKLAVFPYVTDPRNVVYGASGAVRIAMANHIPVIASASHMFDDLEGVLPRPGGVEELAGEIRRVFHDGAYRKAVIGRAVDFVNSHTWDKTADHYLDFLNRTIDLNKAGSIIPVGRTSS